MKNEQTFSKDSLPKSGRFHTQNRLVFSQNKSYWIIHNHKNKDTVPVIHHWQLSWRRCWCNRGRRYLLLLRVLLLLRTLPATSAATSQTERREQRLVHVLLLIAG